MRHWFKLVFSGRPFWMNALMVFCAYMAIVYVPWDFFMKPVALDEEVWFGIRLHGVAAKLTEPLHWAIYAAGAYGFLRMRRWMWPWAALYSGQIAIAMLLWPWLYVGGVSGFFAGIVSFVPFAFLTRALWNCQAVFADSTTTLRERYGEWALVTGASAGIGAEFARALARDGVSCVLTARRGDRLEALASELEKTWSVQTRVVACDLAAAGVEATIGTWSVPTTTYYRERYGYAAGSYPVTSRVFERSLAIPLHENLDEDDQSHVADALRVAVSRYRETAG